MESLNENRPLMFSILGSTLFIFALALGVFPEVAQQFEIVDFPFEVSCILFSMKDSLSCSKMPLMLYSLLFSFQFRMILTQVLCADFALSYIVDRFCLWLFGEGKLSIK